MDLGQLRIHRNPEKLVLFDPIGLWRDDYPVRPLWMILSPGELPGLLFSNPGSETAQQFFALPEDPELAVKAQAQLAWAIACTGKFAWPLPDLKLTERLHRIQAETLIIWGADDQLVPSVYAEEFAQRIPRAEVLVIEHCGHIPEVEATDRVIEAVGEFLL